ncbi:MAG: NotI family restriction endonuclease [Candidatus Burarchaeum sp.]|nr:NotI family restriction endonuclease [Candidatus Burarchaeum sp.]MDO8339069.1 NotI family restriction endonuclease [Candidatus Burarchaeum sp.]
MSEPSKDEPPVKKFPTEYFGHPYSDLSKKAQEDRKNQSCSYLNGECKKPRKSEPKTKVGDCSIGYNCQVNENGKIVKKFLPVIICPHRFKENSVFDSVAENYFGAGFVGKVVWVPEVSLGVGGSVDYVAIVRDDSDPSKIKDYVLVEFQAAGTTGTPWAALQELKLKGKYEKDSYNYGINWANEFLKTMMQQVYKKGPIAEALHRKIIFVIQDVGLEYIRNSCDASGLHEVRKTDQILFYTFRMQWNARTGQWKLVFDNKYGTDFEGIRKILSGSKQSEYPAEEEFIKNIQKKLKKS